LAGSEFANLALFFVIWCLNGQAIQLVETRAAANLAKDVGGNLQLLPVHQRLITFVIGCSSLLFLRCLAAPS